MRLAHVKAPVQRLFAGSVGSKTPRLRLVAVLLLAGTLLIIGAAPGKALPGEGPGKGEEQASTCAGQPPSRGNGRSCGQNGEGDGDPGVQSCTDGVDNDGDGAPDGADAECTDPNDGQEDGFDGAGNSLHSSCTDGLDNDGGDRGAKDEQDPECTDPNDGVEDGSDERCHASGGDGGLNYGAIPEVDGPDYVNVPLVGRVKVNAVEEALNERRGDPNSTIAERYGRGGADQGFGPLTEDPEGNGVVSGEVRDAGEGSANEPVTDEVACAVDLLVLETASPVDP